MLIRIKIMLPRRTWRSPHVGADIHNDVSIGRPGIRGPAASNRVFRRSSAKLAYTGPCTRPRLREVEGRRLLFLAVHRRTAWFLFDPVILGPV